MKTPGEKQIIQIIVTNRCDLLRCSNCTQMLTHQSERFTMSPTNFRVACESLAEYPGVIGVFGGNPCTHPNFIDLCAIMREVIPDRRRRGLWTNSVNGHADVIRETFGYFNFNVHANAAAAAEIQARVIEPLRGVPGVRQETLRVWGADRPSWHAPILVAVRDIIKDEAEMWAAIERCDINLHWSGAITQRRGHLRAYFCEVAAAFDNVYDSDVGVDVVPGWWSQPMTAYAQQVNRWCVNCGVPLKMRGHVDLDFADDVSRSHSPLVEITSKGKRIVHLHDHADDHTHEVTDYQHLRRKGARR